LFTRNSPPFAFRPPSPQDLSSAGACSFCPCPRTPSTACFPPCAPSTPDAARGFFYQNPQWFLSHPSVTDVPVLRPQTATSSHVHVYPTRFPALPWEKPLARRTPCLLPPPPKPRPLPLPASATAVPIPPRQFWRSRRGTSQSPPGASFTTSLGTPNPYTGYGLVTTRLFPAHLFGTGRLEEHFLHPPFFDLDRRAVLPPPWRLRPNVLSKPRLFSVLPFLRRSPPHPLLLRPLLFSLFGQLTPPRSTPFFFRQPWPGRTGLFFFLPPPALTLRFR